jgi:HlyD family secretion protein
MNRLVVAVLVLGTIGGGGYWYYRYSKKPTPPTVTRSAVTRGDVVESVGATGTLQAVTTVQVGSQVSGNIAYLGADFNSLVKKGQVLARLDPSLFEAQAQQSRANLAQARANFTKAQSDLERNRVQLIDAQQKYSRAKELSARSLLPQSDLDAAKTAVDTAQAAVQSQQATVSQVQAAISQAEAGLNQSQVNLAHTVITAPIDGLVISRSVDVGQTVAASMQAPTLFVLAADLTKMQVVANLDESDVGRIRPNQTVTFRVDAYAQDMFRGTVSQVRLEPKVQQNVVTYATVIDVPNNDLRLKPGMTANVNIEISRASNVLRISNSALRFRPSNDVFAALGQTPPEPQGRGGFQGGGRRADTANGAGPEASSAPGTSSAPGNGPSGSGAANQADPSHTQPSASAARRSSDPAASAPRADAPGAGQNAKGNAPHGAEGSAPAQGSSQADDDRRKRLAERMQNMSPEEREATTARLRERGIDPNNPGAGGGRGSGGRGAGNKEPGTGRSGQVAPAVREGGATTIDALFAPLPRTESFGRAWIFADNQLRPARLRLGISDGQNTEVIEGDVKEGDEAVSNVVIAGQSTRPATTAFPGFGGGRQGFPGGGFPGGGGGNRGGTGR